VISSLYDMFALRRRARRSATGSVMTIPTSASLSFVSP
jgi:hypothetical protein